MKLIALAIHLNSKPFRLTGLNFSVVNYETVVAVSGNSENNFQHVRIYLWYNITLRISFHFVTDSQRRRFLLYSYLCL